MDYIFSKVQDKTEPVFGKMKLAAGMDKSKIGVVQPRATRTSARIVAKQGLNLPRWKTPTGNNDEKRMMQAMVKHLQETDEVDNVALYKYLFREAEIVKTQLHLVPVLRKVRARMAELEAPFLKYDPATRTWMYWNDFTLTGLTAWRDQQFRDDRTGAKPGMHEDAEEENSEKEDTDTSTMEQAAENVEDSDEEISGQGANVAAEDEESDEDGTKVAGPPPGTDPEDTDIPDTEYSPPLISAATAVAPPPGESPSSAWLTSPVQKYNPYTGRTTSAPLSFRLQEMVQELQAHSDWYEEHSPATLRPITIDLTTPEAPTSEPKKQSGQTQPGEKPHTLPGDTPTSPARTRRHHQTATPQADNDGFIPVAGQRFASPAQQRTHPMDRQSISSTTPSNRYAVLMETAVDTMNEHSRALENAAMERHRLRMERTQQEVQTAMEDALAHFHRVTAKQVVEHKNSIQDFCDQRTADMAEQLDNFTGEAERIR